MGMSKDDSSGRKSIKSKGGKTIAPKKTSTVFGMPKIVIIGGTVNKILALQYLNKTCNGVDV